MSAPEPLLSVILVCRNPGAQLPAALASVEAQAGVALELVVIDGASTDGTPAWLAANAARLGAWVSEPDRGVYDAMNKGVARARGEWLYFLGVDDRLEPGALAAVAANLARAKPGVVVGEAVYTDGRAYRPQPLAHAIRRNFLHHQACFYHRSAFQLGAYDASLRYQGDYHLNLRVLRLGFPFAVVPVRVARCGVGGASDAGHWANYREEITVRHRHFPAWRCWAWDLAAIARWLRKRGKRAAGA